MFEPKALLVYVCLGLAILALGAVFAIFGITISKRNKSMDNPLPPLDLDKKQTNTKKSLTDNDVEYLVKDTPIDEVIENPKAVDKEKQEEILDIALEDSKETFVVAAKHLPNLVEELPIYEEKIEEIEEEKPVKTKHQIPLNEFDAMLNEMQN